MGRIDDIEARIEAASEGPWHGDLEVDKFGKSSALWGNSDALQEPVAYIPHDDIIEEGEAEVRANWELLTHVHEDYAHLLYLVKQAIPIMQKVLRDGHYMGSNVDDFARKWLIDKEET